MKFTLPVLLAVALATLLIGSGGEGQDKTKKEKKAAPPWPTPALPDGKSVVTDVSDAFLKPLNNNLLDGVVIAKTAPKIDFLYYPGQTYKASIWSNWGDGL